MWLLLMNYSLLPHPLLLAVDIRAAVSAGCGTCGQYDLEQGSRSFAVFSNLSKWLGRLNGVLLETLS